MLTSREASEALGLSLSSVRRLARTGALKATRLTQGSHLRFAPTAIQQITEGATMGVRKERGWYHVEFECADTRNPGETIRVHRKSPSNRMRDAEILERVIRAQIAAGTWGQQAPPTLRAFAKDYVRHLRVEGRKPAYVHDAESVLRHHLAPRLGRVSLARIGIQEIDRIKEELSATLARKTVNNILGHLHNLLRLAVEYGKIRSAPPARLFPRQAPADADYRWLSKAESDQLVAACTGRVRSMVVVALHTALRMGELEALRWSDVTDAGLVVCRSWCQQSRAFVETKTSMVRVVPLNPTARTALDSWPRHLRSELVWCTASGSVVDKPDMGRQLRAACVRASLEPIGWHCLRHTCASWMVSAGVALYEVQKILGHTTPVMTQRYAHLAPERLRGAVEAIG